MIASDNFAAGNRDEQFLVELVVSKNSDEGFFYNRDASSKAFKIGMLCGSLYIALCYCEAFVGDQGDRPWFKASFKEIGEVCGMSARSAMRHLPALVDAGLLEIKSGRKKGSSTTRNSYRLTHSGEAWRQNKSTEDLSI